jgi:hypothetical protein
VAGSEQSLTLAGLRAAACRSGDSVRLGGTSVAAPVVVRAVANQVLHGNSGQDSAAIKAALLALATPRLPSEDATCLGAGRFKSLAD